MADNTVEAVFDMPKILAKLHLAALMPVKDMKNKENGLSFIVNTGIVDDDDSATPEKPGKVTFNLDNPSETYEVGYVTLIKGAIEFSYEHSLESLRQLHTKIAKLPMSSKTDEESPEIKQTKNEIQSLIEDICAKMGVDIEPEVKDDLKQPSDLDESEPPADASNDKSLYKRMFEIFTSSDKDISAKEKDLEKELDVLKTERDIAYKQTVENVRGKAAEVLTQYMQVFAGKDTVKQLTNNDLGFMVVPYNASNASYKDLVKDFEIQSISDGEYARLMAKWMSPSTAKSKSNEQFLQRVCFRIRYSLASI